MTKEEILNGIHELLSKNVIGGAQMMARYKGFRGELFFENFLSEKYPVFKILEGGIIMSKNSTKTSLDNSMYFTVLPDTSDLGDYKNIYKALSNIGFMEMYIILYADDWQEKEVMKFETETISLKVPSLKILKFDAQQNEFIETNNDVKNVTGFLEDLPKRGKNQYAIEPDCKEWLIANLSQFSEKQLLKIYMDRLFFDGFIGFSKNKGKSSDIDLILIRPTGEYRFIEIKEKDLPKSNQGFGLDVPRLEDLGRIQEQSSIEYYLAVRHINNQEDRELIGWKYISITEFEKDVKGNKTIEGGTGMRSSYSSNPTLICSLSKFRNL
ncbi:hypothetical protein A7A78_14185 [Aequorivita soesokkakensis]|uniref:Uncharacterized protein n=1 Tax=Aequorivita soesokkakensis TaxID=1385699 RepID=A0A1A9LCL8_9FLAO|nr:hypothetical protein [Aequorivita soesokkakensis]OAD90714.1 hypothetical protein A7A78_14185 [Aequorivita soesokkakensis]